MIVWGWWTRGARSTSTQVALVGSQWVWQDDLTGVRVFPPRIRDDYWVEIGHSENDDPAKDSREG